MWQNNPFVVGVARHMFGPLVPVLSASHVIRTAIFCLYGRRRTSYVRPSLARTVGVARHTFDHLVPYGRRRTSYVRPSRVLCTSYVRPSRAVSHVMRRREKLHPLK
ncbi:hypothetical protein AVEN_216179-1 [Araneus ventricosus]|uniref:Uncharacterized protein n=1 Tax=Araneus ventricosus TaxID=182803 RepID=A0A4Y2T886_ARAVE|nr:hypothetical protein AVEN_111217-1 [Araneus ventricosus]GBN96411.1 hypothetical protein AVEN_216179-1 [Araneus ventricosus]